MGTPRHRRGRLATKFLRAGALFVAATIACGAWSAYTFARLSVVVGQTLRDSQQALDLTANLAGLLEREDDALLLAIAEPRDTARNALASRRPLLDAQHAHLVDVLTEPDERSVAGRLRRDIDRYRAAGDELLGIGNPDRALVRYHESVNPILREAAGDCARIRELNFRSMERAGIEARDEARRATKVVVVVLAMALAMSILVALGLARAVVRPIAAITATVIRCGGASSAVAFAWRAGTSSGTSPTGSTGWRTRSTIFAAPIWARSSGPSRCWRRPSKRFPTPSSWSGAMRGSRR